MVKKKLKAQQDFAPVGYLKATLYIGSSPDLVKAIGSDMQRKKLKFSPLMIHAYNLYHALDHEIEYEAEQRGLKPADLINQAVAAYLKKR